MQRLLAAAFCRCPLNVPNQSFYFIGLRRHSMTPRMLKNPCRVAVAHTHDHEGLLHHGRVVSLSRVVHSRHPDSRLSQRWVEESRHLVRLAVLEEGNVIIGRSGSDLAGNVERGG